MRTGMRLSSVVLATPIKLRGRPTDELPGEEKDIELRTNDERHMLEIWQGGKLVALKPFAQVVDMRPAEKAYRCSHPGCTDAFDDLKGLGPHMRHAHGVKAGA